MVLMYARVDYNKQQMQLKCWLLVIRVLNILCAVLMTAFEIWYLVELFMDKEPFITTLIRIFTPIFVILLAFIIITSEFKYSKVVEYFKFLQLIPGLALFDIFLASIFAFQFSTVDEAPIITACLFIVLAIVTAIMGCLRPAGTQSLLSAQQ